MTLWYGFWYQIVGFYKINLSISFLGHCKPIAIFKGLWVQKWQKCRCQNAPECCQIRNWWHFQWDSCKHSDVDVILGSDMTWYVHITIIVTYESKHTKRIQVPINSDLFIQIIRNSARKPQRYFLFSIIHKN